MIISPKKEFAHANQARVLTCGLSIEKDSCIRLSFECKIRLLRQFLISPSLLVVNICVIKARGHMFLMGVWELPTPFI